MSKSLDTILEGFNPNAARPEDYTTLTLWVPIDVKTRYKKIQQTSRREFSKRLTELVEAAIALAEEKTS